MNSSHGQFVASRRMGLCEPIHQINMWGDFKGNTSASMILEIENLDNQSENALHGKVGPSNIYGQDTSKPIDKMLRRLEQNREAARKSRLRKKAYVQQLENSKLKLIQLEQELQRARQQGLCVGGGLDTSNLSYSENANSEIAAFEMKYGHWIEEQNRQTNELRSALHPDVADLQLQILVEDALNHYFNLFQMKSAAAKADVFYILSGMWKTSAERFLFWIGGFRPSDLLKVLLPHLEPLSEQQHLDVCDLIKSCQQAEEALSQGMVKLRQFMAEAVAAGKLGEENYLPQLESAMEKMEAVVRFVNQADHLRQVTLQQMHRILTTHQAARGLLALGEYSERLRMLSSNWATLPREPA